MEKAAINFCELNKIRLSIIMTGIYGDPVLPEHCNIMPTDGWIYDMNDSMLLEIWQTSSWQHCQNIGKMEQ